MDSDIINFQRNLIPSVFKKASNRLIEKSLKRKNYVSITSSHITLLIFVNSNTYAFDFEVNEPEIGIYDGTSQSPSEIMVKKLLSNLFSLITGK